MGITTITAEFKNNGIIFDPDSVVLRDPTGTYGIKRTDTGEIVCAAGIPMLYVSPGNYAYGIGNLDPAVNYTAYIEYLYEGEAHYILRSIDSDTTSGSTPTAASAYDRISARKGQNVVLNASFYRGGIPTDPYAIYRVEIFRGSVSAQNIVDAVDIASVDSTSYPSPLERWAGDVGLSSCPDSPNCSSHLTQTSTTGRFKLIWQVPSDAVVPDVYFDVWYYYASDPDTSGTTLLEQCNRFWVYPDNWYVDGGLQTIRLGFEPIDIKFRKPERRPIEVGLMPLPLYDYDYNLVAPILPYISPTITIWTAAGEEIVSNATCTMKLRQGSYRSNPYVISYMLDTCTYFKGTYKYRVKASLPDGSTRVSGDFFFTVS